MDFSKFEKYLRDIPEELRINLPKTEEEFVIWWSKICISDELYKRWIDRIG